MKPGLYARFETSMGNFTAELHEKQAPQTVANFADLATGAKEWKDPKTGEAQTGKPFYDGLVFHRVIDNFMIQGGCPLGSGTGGPGFKIKDEFSPQLRHNKEGLLSMANAGPNTGGSQFFVTLVPTNWLDDKHAIFGEVVEGMDVVKKIGKTQVGAQDRPVTPVELKKVTIERVK